MEHQYLALLQELLTQGHLKPDRTGTGTRSLFGRWLRHDLREGFPLLTTKKIHLKSIVHELLWFLSGDTNIRYLVENGVTIWNEWAEHHELGPVYGGQWRRWRGPNGEEIDQVQNLLEGLKTNPHSRRHIINAWNVAYLPKNDATSAQQNVREGRMALPPCHVMYQFYVAEGRLSCLLTMRSSDVFLGLPFNVASVALLTHLVAQQCALEPGEIVLSLGDVHLYANHVQQAELQLTRPPRALPTLRLARQPDSLFDYRYDDVTLEGYDPHPAIAAPIAV